MARKVDPLKEKQKKQKKIAIGGSVLLVAVLAFQVPRTMKMLHHGSSSSVAVPAPTAAPPAGTPELAAPTLHGAEPSTTTASGSLATATGPSEAESRLQSFGRFESKDPFKQQLGETGSAAAPTTAPATGSSGSSPAPTSGSSAPTLQVPAPSSGSASAPVSTPSTSSSSATGSTPPAPAAPAPAPTSAVISVNGTLASVDKGADFPQPTTEQPDATPYFRLVSLTAKSAKISVVGGSYSNGKQTVTLQVGKPLTLVNTADGTRYRLVLMRQGTQVPTSAPATTTTSAP